MHTVHAGSRQLKGAGTELCGPRFSAMPCYIYCRPPEVEPPLECRPPEVLPQPASGPLRPKRHRITYRQADPVRRHRICSASDAAAWQPSPPPCFPNRFFFERTLAAGGSYRSWHCVSPRMLSWGEGLFLAATTAILSNPSRLLSIDSRGGPGLLTHEAK